MKHVTRAVYLTIGIYIISVSVMYAQNDSAERDSTFNAYLKGAWNKIQESEFSDTLQNQYAKEFFEYYKAHKGSKSAEDAFNSSFIIWGNTGNYDYTEEALATLEDDSELWGSVIAPLGNIYARNENLDLENYIEYLNELEGSLKDPKSLSEVLVHLIRYNEAENDSEKVQEYAQKILKLDAGDFYVDFALGELYELESLQIGQEAPTFVTEAVDGNSLSLAEMNGKFVLLEFWGTWCGPCRPEIPHLKALQDKHEEEKLSIVGIALDENEKEVQDFIIENEMNWPQILQSEMWDSEIVSSYNVFGVPRMYLVDPEGKIVAKDLRGEEMESEVDRMITEYFEE